MLLTMHPRCVIILSTALGWTSNVLAVTFDAAGCTEARGTGDCSNLGLRAIPTAIPAGLNAFDVSGNTIGNVDSTDTSEITTVTSLSLADNAISVITDDTFDAMTLLQTLDLSGNSLTQVTSSMLADNPNLVSINLARNQIAGISRGGLDLPNLQVLDLSNNLINDPFSRVLWGLPLLQEIYLDGNLLEFIPVGFFNFNSALRIAGLSNNQLTELQSDTFTFQSVLVFVDFSNNSISYIGVNALVKDTLETLLMSGNPSQCSLVEQGTSSACSAAPCDVECSCNRGLLGTGGSSCTVTTPTTTPTTTATSTDTSTASTTATTSTTESSTTEEPNFRITISSTTSTPGGSGSGNGNGNGNGNGYGSGSGSGDAASQGGDRNRGRGKNNVKQKKHAKKYGMGKKGGKKGLSAEVASRTGSAAIIASACSIIVLGTAMAVYGGRRKFLAWKFQLEYEPVPGSVESPVPMNKEGFEYQHDFSMKSFPSMVISTQDTVLVPGTLSQ